MALILKHDTYQNWTTLNPVLSKGEVTVDTTNNKLKVGDGVKHWKDLPYSTGSIELSSDQIANSDNVMISKGNKLVTSSLIYNPASATLTLNEGNGVIRARELEGNSSTSTITKGLEVRSSVPDSPVVGQVYYDNTKDIVYVCSNAQSKKFIPIGNGSQSNNSVTPEQLNNILTLSSNWANSLNSPDNQEDNDSPTHKTQSSKSWALSSKSYSLESKTKSTESLTNANKSKEFSDKAKEYSDLAQTYSDKAKKYADKAAEDKQQSSSKSSNNVLVFDTVEKMKAINFDELEDNTMIITKGFYKEGVGGATYIITLKTKLQIPYDTPFNCNLMIKSILGNANKIAVLRIEDYTYDLDKLGYKDGENCSDLINNLINYYKEIHAELPKLNIVGNSTYTFNNRVNLIDNTTIKLSKVTSKLQSDSFLFNAFSKLNISLTIDNLIVLGSISNPVLFLNDSRRAYLRINSLYNNLVRACSIAGSTATLEIYGDRNHMYDTLISGNSVVNLLNSSIRYFNPMDRSKVTAVSCDFAGGDRLHPEDSSHINILNSTIGQSTELDIGYGVTGTAELNGVSYIINKGKLKEVNSVLSKLDIDNPTTLQSGDANLLKNTGYYSIEKADKSKIQNLPSGNRACSLEVSSYQFNGYTVVVQKLLMFMDDYGNNMDVCYRTFNVNKSNTWSNWRITKF